MKIFIINLKRCPEKRNHMLQQLLEHNISNYEFIEAIDGRDFSENDFNYHVKDYESSGFIPGEIGCALSHIFVYRKMVAENIYSAIILEDDVIIPEILPELSTSLATSLNKCSDSKVISLGRPNKYNTRKIFWSFKNFREFTAISAFGTYAYAINLAAAKSLSENLYPVTFEADMFIHFRENGWLKHFHLISPQVVKIIDNHDELSDLHGQRQKDSNKRTRYRKDKLLKSRPFMQKIKIKLLRNLRKLGQVTYQD